jgi:hypothetical protein
MKLILILVLLGYLTSAISGQSVNDTIQVNPPECGTKFTEQKPARRFLSSTFVRNQKDLGWLVLLNSTGGSLKSGSLINSQWVLTVAKDIKYDD